MDGKCSNDKQRARGWCFTINNPTEEDLQTCINLQEVASFIVVGQEIGESGTLHFQGTIYFNNARTFKAVKHLLGGRAHLERIRGTVKQSADYCRKEGCVIVESGDCPLDQKEKGLVEKERWDNAKMLAMEGKIDDIDSDIYIRYYGGLKSIMKDHPSKPDNLEDCCGVWIYGQSGFGKSHKARADFPDFYDKSFNKWWDGYQGEEAVIMDDADPDNVKYLVWFMKRWLDKYSFPAETKGGVIWLRPKYIVITSQYSVEECFPDPTAYDAISRRIKTVTHLTTSWQDREGVNAQ